MNKTINLFFLCLIMLCMLTIFGCEPRPREVATPVEHTMTRYVCTCEEKEKAQSFIQNSIKNANNMSDEEMEDVIHQLYKTGIKLNCKERMVHIVPESYGTIDYNKTTLGECESVMDF